MPRNRKLASPFHYFNSSPEVIRKAAEVFGCNGDIRETLAGHITEAPLLEKFGDRISSDCTRLCDLVAVLPMPKLSPLSMT